MKYFASTAFAAATGVVALFAPLSLSAQQTPSPAQAAELLQRASQQPGGAEQIRARLRESGLTPEQVRARLQASGYAPNLLDAYLADTTAGRPAPTPGSNVLEAIRALGLPPISVQRDTLPVDTGMVRARAIRPTHLDSISPVFGVDVFRRSTTQFLPTLSGPVPADYRIGPGDQLVLILTGSVELAHQLTVTREGFVLIPQVGQVFVANLTMDQLRNTLYDRLGRVYSSVRRGPGATTRFDVTVASVRAVQVYVIGEVAQPGAYQVSSLGTVLTGLYAAGGVTERSNMRRIAVRRGGRDVATLDLYDYLLRGDTRADVRLETGDVIYVPVHGTRAEVKGAVVRPAIYEVNGTETLAELIAAAGGLRADASVERIQIKRIVPPVQRRTGGAQRVVLDVPLDVRERGTDTALAIPRFSLADGDIVTVDSVTAAQRNYVEIEGNVYLPGEYAYEPGMRLSRLVQLAGGFQPATFAGRAHIERLNAADSTRRLLAAELPRDSAAPWPEDPALADRDVVTIYGRAEMRATITVAISGMVNQPGPYPWREGMTLRDLMLRARGPRLGADLREAEVSRLPADRTQGQLAVTVRVPLDSTYLFDRDSLGRYMGPPGVSFSPSGSPEVPLQPYDNVLVLRQPDFELQRTVVVQGQVRFPGTYDLRRKDERLADLIERAGGLTAQAYAEGIRFFRTKDSSERVNIDLSRALREPASRDNIILQPSDSIYIPEYQPIVRVSGAVNAPGLVLWRRGAGLGYYISAAGGFTRVADRGGTSVRQPNGEVEKAGRVLLLFRTEPEPGPGAEVSVPARDPEDKTDILALVGAIAQILASTVAIVVVATR